MKRILENIRKSFNPSKEEFNAIVRAFSTVQVEKNAYFLKAGEICRSVGFIEKGSMRLFFNSDKKEACSDFFFENSFIGSFASFLSQQPSIVNISAIENCELLVLSHEKVMELMRQYPSVRNLANAILLEQFIRAEKREQSLVLLQPEERFLKIVEEHPKLFKRVPLHYVASYLAITPETLSRYRNKKTAE